MTAAKGTPPPPEVKLPAANKSAEEFGKDVQLAPFVVNGKKLSISIWARTKSDRRYAEDFAEEVVGICYETLGKSTGNGLVIIGREGEPHPVVVVRKFLALAKAGQLDPAVAAKVAELNGKMADWKAAFNLDEKPVEKPAGEVKPGEKVSGGHEAAEKVSAEDEPEEQDAGEKKPVEVKLEAKKAVEVKVGEKKPEDNDFKLTFDLIVTALPLPLEGVGSKLYLLSWAEGFDDARIDKKLRSLTVTDLESAVRQRRLR